MGLGEPEPVPSKSAEEDQRDFLPEEPLPGGSPHPAPVQRDGGRGRPHALLDRSAGVAGGSADPAGVLRHFRAADGNQLRGVIW